jgi:hypothetical protein
MDSMDSTVIASIIGLISATLAAIIRRSDFLDRVRRPKTFMDLRGDWDSSWSDSSDNDKNLQKNETITITRVRRNRVVGEVKSREYEDKPCRVEGFFNGRFLQLMWSPSKKTATKLIDDYGCYFFEKQADGTFKGYSVGFLHKLNAIHSYEHTLRKVN